MARFYVYDMSRYCGDLPGWEWPENGLYESFDVKHYFEQKDHYAYFIKVGEEIAGFVLIHKKEDTHWTMGEFFVLAKFQRKGVGKRPLNKCFKCFQVFGKWRLCLKIHMLLRFGRK